MILEQFMYLLFVCVAVTLLNIVILMNVTKDKDKLGCIIGIVWVIGIYVLLIITIMETI